MRPFNSAIGYTSVPNAVIDVLMPLLPGNAFKLLMLIIRQTRGYQRASDRLSYSQLMAGIGTESPATVRAALECLLARQLIVATGGGGWKAREYRLNDTYEIDDSTTKTVAPPTTEIVVPPTTKTVVTTEIVADSTTEIVVPPTTKIVDTERKSKEKKERGSRAPRNRGDAPPDPTPRDIRQALADACQVDLKYGTRGDVLQVNTVSAELWRMAQEQRAPPAAVVTGIQRTADYCRRAVFPFNNGKNERIKPAAIQANWRAAYEEQRNGTAILSATAHAAGGANGQSASAIAAAAGYKSGSAIRAPTGRNGAAMSDVQPAGGGARDQSGVQRPANEVSE